VDLIGQLTVNRRAVAVKSLCKLGLTGSKLESTIPSSRNTGMLQVMREIHGRHTTATDLALDGVSVGQCCLEAVQVSRHAATPTSVAQQQYVARSIMATLMFVNVVTSAALSAPSSPN
jgi:hypothetical protein